MSVTPAQLEKFALALIARAGFDKLPENFRQDFKGQIIDECLNRLGLLLVAELTPEQHKEYEKLLLAADDPTSDPKISQFVAQSVPDFAAKSMAVLRAYGEEFLSEASKALDKSYG